MTKFNTLEFIANNAGLSMVEAIEKAYELGKAEMQPSDDCISKEAVESVLYNLGLGDEENGGAEYKSALWDVQEALKNLRPITPQPKIGKWTPRNAYLLRYKCSECGWKAEKSNYCPNCGAKMEVK